MTNNKIIGTRFEKDFCRFLADRNWWVHFLNPDRSGAQPFDIIAIKDSRVLAVDCKTCKAYRFPLSRVEDNQWLAFDALIWKTNAECGFIIVHKNELYFLPYGEVVEARDEGRASIKLDERYLVTDESFY